MRPRGTPIGLQLARTSKTVGRAFNDALAEAGGSLPVWLILTTLRGEAHASQQELARAIGVEGPTLTRHLDQLEAAGPRPARPAPGRPARDPRRVQRKRPRAAPSTARGRDRLQPAPDCGPLRGRPRHAPPDARRARCERRAVGGAQHRRALDRARARPGEPERRERRERHVRRPRSPVQRLGDRLDAAEVADARPAVLRGVGVQHLAASGRRREAARASPRGRPARS